MAYSTRRGTYAPWNRGPQPVVELLIDGEPWGQFRARTFRFGNRICRMLLSDREVLEEFLRSDGRNPESIDQVFRNGLWLSAPVIVQGYSEFEGPAGHIIQRPYLKFSCEDSREKGIGLKKAQGLLSVWKDLETFATEVGVP